MEPMEIRANFKQATVKGGTAVLQLEILTSDANASPILKLSGKPVVLTVADIHDELPLDYDEEEVRAAPVRPTGERGRGDGRGIRGHHGRGANDWRR